MTWMVYILRCKDKTLYCGVTNDLDLRLEKHTLGTGAKYTRGRGPFELLRSEEFPDKSAALKREIAIKKLTRAQKLELCENKI